MKNYQATLILPAYNEEEVIGKVLEGLKRYEDSLEVIVVDDGSTDKTYEIATNAQVKVIRHPYNKGYGAAIKTGAREASSDILLIMDCDGQHDPADLELLLDKSKSYDMVVGARAKGSNSPLFRRPGKKLLSMTANFLVDRKIPDLNSGFRAVKRARLMEFAHILPNGFSFSTTLTLALLSSAYDVLYVPIKAHERQGGKSSLLPLKDGLETLSLILKTIVLFNPLKVFLPIALLLFFGGSFFTLFGIIFYHKAPNTGVLTTLSGVLIFFFGFLADQVSALRREGHRGSFERGSPEEEKEPPRPVRRRRK